MNIYRDSSFAYKEADANLPADATFESITTSNLIVPTGQKGDILTFEEGGVLTGVAIGPQNYVVTSDISGTGLPRYSNALTLNSLTTTSFSIPETQNGDLLVMNGSQHSTRLPIGAAGYILTSNGATPQWQPLVLTNNRSFGFFSFFSGTLNNFASGTSHYFPTFYANQYSNGFTTNSSVITYNGSVTKTFKISASLTFISSLDNTNFSLFIYNPLTSVQLVGGSRVGTKTGVYYSLTAITVLLMAPGASVNVQFARNDALPGLTNITFPFASPIVIEQLD